jgi:excisionase family DNA binding protein
MSEASYVTLDELAAHIGVKVSTIRQWVKRAHIPRHTYIKAGSTYRFCQADVVEALRQEDVVGRKATAGLMEAEKKDTPVPVKASSGIEDMIKEFDDDC